MKRIVVMLLIIAMVVVSCGGKASNDPKEVAKQFVEASFKGDAEAIKPLIKKSELEGLKATEDDLKVIKDMNLQAEVTVDSIKEDGEEANAEVTVKLTVEGMDNPKEQKMNIHLIIEDGKWVVDMLNSK